jgi:hypothetical protein
MILGPILNYVLGAALAAVLAFSAYAWFIHGHARYVEGKAEERAHWQDVIRRANQTIDGLNGDADRAKGERGDAVSALLNAATKIEIVTVPIEVSKPCDLPDGVRKSLNAINIKGKK